MQVQFKLTVGENEFTLVDTVESHAEFFKKMSFYSTLPKVGPNGETDLVIQHRRAQDKYDYFSIVSKKANQEFKFGQSKTAGQLFAKGWEPLFNGEDNEEGASENSSSQGLGASSSGLGAGSSSTKPAASKPAAGLGASTPTPAQPAKSETTNSKVQEKASNILAKFGI